MTLRLIHDCSDKFLVGQTVLKYYDLSDDSKWSHWDGKDSC